LRGYTRVFPLATICGCQRYRLSEQQLDARRRGLEQYLEKVCAVRVIAESDAMQEFLTDRLEEDGDQGPAVDLKVLLPDREVVTVTVPKAASVKDVYDAVCCRVGLDADTAKYFYLFEIVEYNFGTRPIESINFTIVPIVVVC